MFTLHYGEKARDAVDGSEDGAKWQFSAATAANFRSGRIAIRKEYLEAFLWFNYAQHNFMCKRHKSCSGQMYLWVESLSWSNSQRKWRQASALESDARERKIKSHLRLVSRPA
jgi:hypothetical protein